MQRIHTDSFGESPSEPQGIARRRAALLGLQLAIVMTFGMAACQEPTPTATTVPPPTPTATASASPSPFRLSVYQTAVYERGTPVPSPMEAARATYVAEVFTRTPLPTWEPKPTSTRYTSDDVMNNITSCCHWAMFAWDPDVVVSATFGAELERTVETHGDRWPDEPVPVPTSYWEYRYMELHVTEVFKGEPWVRAGDRLVVVDSHPDNELRMIVDYSSAPLARPVSGTLNLFFLKESDRVSPHGPVYGYDYPAERLVVTAEGAWIATPERHRMLSVMDMPGAVFLRQLRSEIALAEAMKARVRKEQSRSRGGIHARP